MDLLTDRAWGTERRQRNQEESKSELQQRGGTGCRPTGKKGRKTPTALPVHRKCETKVANLEEEERHKNGPLRQLVPKVGNNALSGSRKQRIR